LTGWRLSQAAWGGCARKLDGRSRSVPRCSTARLPAPHGGARPSGTCCGVVGSVLCGVATATPPSESAAAWPAATDSRRDWVVAAGSPAHYPPAAQSDDPKPRQRTRVAALALCQVPRVLARAGVDRLRGATGSRGRGGNGFHDRTAHTNPPRCRPRTCGFLNTKPSAISLRTAWRELANEISEISLGSSLRAKGAPWTGRDSGERQKVPHRIQPCDRRAQRHTPSRKRPHLPTRAVSPHAALANPQDGGRQAVLQLEAAHLARATAEIVTFPATHHAPPPQRNPLPTTSRSQSACERPPGFVRSCAALADRGTVRVCKGAAARNL